MATADTRRVLAARRRSDRDRKRKQRDLESKAAVPSVIDVDHALVIALRRQIESRYEGIKKLPKDSELHAVIASAVSVLHERGYSTDTPKARSRMRAALGY